MLGFILRRTVYAVPSLFGLLVVTFLMVRVVPADPAPHSPETMPRRSRSRRSVTSMVSTVR